MEDAPEKRPSFPYLSVVRALVRDVATSLRPSSLQNARSSSGSMIRWNTQGSAEPGLAGVLAVKDGAVEPHVKPIGVYLATA